MTGSAALRLAALICLPAASVWAQGLETAPEEAQGAARGIALVRMGEANAFLSVLAQDTAHARDGEAHVLTVWAAMGPRDFEDDMVAALRLSPEGGGWTVTGQITLIEEESFHGAILDTDFGAQMEVISLTEADGLLRLGLRAVGPTGRAQGDVGSNDFGETVPGSALIVLEVPVGPSPPAPPD